MDFYLFPKNLQHFSMEKMIEQTARLGFDGPTALIRDGFWLDSENITQKLPEYIKCAETYGLKVKYADSDLSLDSLKDDKNQQGIMKCLADNGIECVRMNHVVKNDSFDPRNYADNFKRQCENTVKIAQKVGIKSVVQIHGYCYPHNATTAYMGVSGLDSKYIGVKIDPGNNFAQEGYELFSYQTGLLKEYVAALGVKDCGYFRINKNIETNDKGWQRAFVPSYEGFINYNDVFSNLKKIDFDGPVVLMPFYDSKNDEEFLDKLKRELSYFKQVSDGIEG